MTAFAARLAILAALWSPLAVSACCHPTVIRRPVVVQPPSCLPGPAPLPPEGAAFGSPRWSRYYVDLSSWIVAVEEACSAPPSVEDGPAAAGRYGS